MPKISTNKERLTIDGLSTLVDIVIMYNQHHRFYTVIPDKYKDTCNCLTQDQLSEFSLEQEYKSKTRGLIGNGEYKWIITDNNEHDCLLKAKKCLKHLICNEAQNEDVIILFYNGNAITTYNNHRYNTEHPQIGIQFGLTYAIKTHLGGDKAIYYQRTGIDGKNRVELNLWNKSATIIPDTPENRAVLENLYEKMKNLNEQLKGFTKTPEDLLNLINSNIKLLH